jgi:hypothetical protein
VRSFHYMSLILPQPDLIVHERMSRTEIMKWIEYEVGSALLCNENPTDHWACRRTKKMIPKS